MAAIDDLVKDFLGQKKIAIVGVSNKRETGCNLNFKKFKDAGYQVFPVNPHIKTYDSQICYPDVKSIPERPDGVFILASPQVTDQIVQQCVDLGIKHIWMHCALGTKPGLLGSATSVSPQAVDLCRSNGIAVIPGSCPNQFLKADFGHALMRGFSRLVGNLSVN